MRGTLQGMVIDHGSPVETCELCEHPSLRYHYEIKNKSELNSLWVGSSCILRFEGINVYDTYGNQLTEEKEREEFLKKIIRHKQIDLMLEPLRKLWRVDKEYRQYIEKMALC